MEDRVSSSPEYLAQTGPVSADKRGRVILASTLRRRVLALDVATQDQALRVNGDYLYIDPDSTGKIYIKLNSTAEDAFPMTAQSAVEGLPVKDAMVSWAAQPGLVVNLWYGYQARFRPPQQSIASIGAIIAPVQLDPEAARYFLFGDDETFDGEAFMGAAAPGPVAGQLATVQVFNPGGSGKILYVDGAEFGNITATGSVFLKTHNAALGGVAVAGINKNVGGAAGVGFLRNGTTAGAGVVAQMYAGIVNERQQVNFQAPIRLVEGQGIHLENQTVNTAMQSSFRWREKPT